MMRRRSSPTTLSRSGRWVAPMLPVPSATALLQGCTVAYSIRKTTPSELARPCPSWPGGDGVPDGQAGAYAVPSRLDRTDVRRLAAVNALAIAAWAGELYELAEEAAERVMGA